MPPRGDAEGTRCRTSAGDDESGVGPSLTGAAPPPKKLHRREVGGVTAAAASCESFSLLRAFSRAMNSSTWT